MLDDEQIEKIRRLHPSLKGYWSHVDHSIEAEKRDYENDPERELLEKMGKSGYELVQILPEWGENPAEAGIFSNPPLKVRRYTYYFKKWFPYD